MDNRFLYRGQSLDTKEWAYGDLICNSLETEQNPAIFHSILDEAQLCDTICFSPIDITTIGQCTGIVAVKSLRGDSEDDRLVFEGDKVAFFAFGSNVQYVGIVVWKNGKWIVDSDAGIFELWHLMDDHRLEIIGDIHGHFELLT